MSEQVNQVATVFDTEEQHVGQVYAKALLQAAASTHSVDAVVDQLESMVADVLNKNKTVDFYLANPKVSVDSKIGFLDRVFRSSMNETLLNFLKVVCRRHRIQFLRAMSRSAVELRDEMAGRMQVQVTTSSALDSQSEKSLISKLGSIFRKEIRLVKKIDPSTIGGLIVRVGDTVFDGSVDGQLRVLRRELSNKAEATIRGQASQLINS